MKQFILLFDTKCTQIVTLWPTSVRPFMLAVTALAFPVVLLPIIVAGTVLFYNRGNHTVSASFFVVLLSLGVNSLLKLFLHRNRPGTLYVGAMKYKTYSFPSGHAFGAVVTYGFIAHLLIQVASLVVGVAIFLLSVLLIISIGVSRIYLGAHFPTDVVAGWIFGTVSLVLIINYLHPLV